MLKLTPDLLSPLGKLEDEHAHCRLICFFLDRQRSPSLADQLLKATLALIKVPREVTDDPSTSAIRVSREVVTREGRVDLQLESTALLAFIEVKVNTQQGASQLLGYQTALEARLLNRLKVLALLTLPGAAGPPEGLDCAHVTFRDLLSCWLPFALGNDHPSRYLASYLSSLGKLLMPSSSDESRALDLVEHMRTP